MLLARRRKNRTSITVTIDRLDKKGVSGVDAEGRRWSMRGAPVGATVSAWPKGRGKAIFIEVTELPTDAVEAPCPVFGTCGGCQLQQMPLGAQRTAKQALVSALVGDTDGLTIHPIVGAAEGYGYRNKVELSFSRRRFVPEASKDDPDEVREGHFLGFHPRGWFSRITPVDRCLLATDDMNAVISQVAAEGLGPAWDNRDHTGSWRHLTVRQGEDGVLAGLVTSSETDPEVVRAVGARLGALPGVAGVLWIVNDRLAEVAEGELAEVLYGEPTLTMQAGRHRLKLPHNGFFQVNSGVTGLLLDTIAAALQPPESADGLLLDLYCGVGAIGLHLADRFAEVIGIELNPASIASAQDNAARLGVESTWHAGPVEQILPTLPLDRQRWIVVDPPRVGLHPDAARFLATQDAEALVYVACNPASLGRDRAILEEGGWKMTELWSVDLFPQTPHVEAVARFVPRTGAP
jgi:23S rRNA (uracil1939-C5)-methyltransferase